MGSTQIGPDDFHGMHKSHYRQETLYRKRQQAVMRKQKKYSHNITQQHFSFTLFALESTSRFNLTVSAGCMMTSSFTVTCGGSSSRLHITWAFGLRIGSFFFLPGFSSPSLGRWYVSERRTMLLSMYPAFGISPPCSACPFWLLCSYFSGSIWIPAFRKTSRCGETTVTELFLSFALASSAASYTRSWTMLLQNRIRSVASASVMFRETSDAVSVSLLLPLLQLTSSATA